MIWGHFTSKNILLLALKIKSASGYFNWIFLFSGMSLSRRKGKGWVLSVAPPLPNAPSSSHYYSSSTCADSSDSSRVEDWREAMVQGLNVAFCFYDIPMVTPSFLVLKVVDLPNSSETLGNYPENLPLLDYWPWHVLIYEEANMNFHSNHKLCLCALLITGT